MKGAKTRLINRVITFEVTQARYSGVHWGICRYTLYTNLPVFVSVYTHLSYHWLNQCCITFRIKAIFVSQCVKNTKFAVNTWGFQGKSAQKPVFCRSSAPDPAGEAYDAPPDTLVGRGRDIRSPFPSSRRLWRLELANCSVYPPQF